MGHLKDVNMTFFEHFLFAMSLSNDFFVGSVKSFIHAICPEIYQTSTTDLIKTTNDKINSRTTHHIKAKL